MRSPSEQDPSVLHPPAVLLEGIVKRYPVGDSEIEVLHGITLRVEHPGPHGHAVRGPL